MYFKKSASVIALAAIASLSACDSDDDSDNGTIDTTIGSQPAPGENPTDPITVEGLAGQWSRTCSALADNAEFSSAQLSIGDDLAILTESFYTDNACTSAASPAVIVTDNSLVFDGAMTSTSLGDASNVASTVESKTIDGIAATDGINAITYDIILITNDTLYFGDRTDPNNGSTEALRPQTLDQTLIFTRL